MNRWDWEEIAILSMMIACGLLLLAAIVGAYLEYTECSSRGGVMVGTGKYTIVMAKVGDVMVPQTIEQRVCSVPKERLYEDSSNQ